MSTTSTTNPKGRPFRVPFRVETQADWEALDSGLYLIVSDGTADGPVLAWESEDGEWLGIRPVSEDDGPWDQLPDSVRDTLAVRVGGIAPDGYDDEESVTPVTVLWHDGLPQVPHPVPTAVELFTAERRRQQDVEGFTTEHDAQHDPHNLLAAARCYMSVALGGSLIQHRWPWAPAYWKPKGPIRNLVRAGALALAANDAYQARGLLPAGHPQANQLLDDAAARLDLILTEAAEVLLP
ncbi:hypothetical protein ACTHAM_002372 [Cellulomonas soli]|uniref:hypothetical protein n=1 Tax=Cellulomonas soli TaxID=931535 RepID=UPI003F82FB0D